MATARDSKGHTISSAAYTWVSGTEYVPWRQDNNDRIKLVADKAEYKVGETAEILVPSPYQGKVKALLTTERGRILSDKVIELAGNSQVAEGAHHRRGRAERLRLAGPHERHGRDEPAAIVQGGPGAAPGIHGRQAVAGDPDPIRGQEQGQESGAGDHGSSRGGHRGTAPAGNPAEP